MAGKDRDEDFAGIFDEIHSQEVTPEVCESGDVAEQEEEGGVRSRRESTRSDRSTINRLKDLQQQEVLDLIHCLSSITDHMHVSHGLQPYGLERGESVRPSANLAQSTAEVRPVTANSIAVPYRRDVPATPSHMQIRIDDLPSALNLRESSFTGDNHANRTSSGRISLHKSYEFGPTASRITSVPERSLSRSYNCGVLTRLLLFLYLYLNLFFIDSECLFGVTKRYIFYPPLTYFLNLSFLHYYFQIFLY